MPTVVALMSTVSQRDQEMRFRKEGPQLPPLLPVPRTSSAGYSKIHGAGGTLRAPVLS